MKNKEILPYNPSLKNLARDLRKNSTLSEVLLWRHLKVTQVLGHDFDRQKPIDDFIVDFFCSELMLAIEIDGETHNYKISRDRERQKRLEGLGVRFLRFTDEEVKQNIEGVISVIERWIRENGDPPLHPSQEGTFMGRHPSREGIYENDLRPKKEAIYETDINRPSGRTKQMMKAMKRETRP